MLHRSPKHLRVTSWFLAVGISLATGVDLHSSNYARQSSKPVTPQKPGQPAPQIPVDTPKPPPTASISGRITSFPDGKPIARARIVLSRPDSEHNWVTITDDQGRYTLTDLDAHDNYMLSASRTGYAARVWGEQQLPAPPTPLKLAAAQKLENIDVALAQHLWVQGVIRDSDGTPFGGAIVSALRAVFIGDRREMVTVAEIITNDRGEYRLFGLPAGQYFISAVDPAFLATRDHQGPLVYAATFYPGVASPEDATRLTLEPGQPRENVDFSLRIIKPARVSGKISSWDNQQLYAGAVVMSPFRADRAATFTVTDVDIRPDGTYEFANVPPGRFIIRSRGETSEDGLSLFGTFTIEVTGRNLTGVDMPLNPGARITGLIQWEGRSPKPDDISEIRVRAPMVDGNLHGDALTGFFQKDDTFDLRGAMVGGHFLRVENLPEPWSLDAVYYRGQNVTDIPLSFDMSQQVTGIRIVLTDRVTRLSGRVVSTPDDDYESYKIVAFPANPIYWRPGSRHIKLVRPDRDGRYAITGLPPATYYLAVARDVDESDIGEPKVLDRLTANAVTLKLGAGEQRKEDLPGTRGRSTGL